MKRNVAEPVTSMARTLLTRAADCEASRQRAVKDGDHQRVQALENELRQLWREYSELERMNR